MKAKAFKIINLILAVLVFVFALSQAFAWFAEDVRKSDDKFDGSSSSPYFNSGDGLTEDTAFTLTSPNHLYNLAWLQNTGNLNDKYYYFRLDNDIDMSGYWLPPIGTDEYPFQGYFNGNGKKISNLKITTDSLNLTGAVSGSSVKYSNAVGMFGMTAAQVGVTTAKIYNFNLIDPIVEVATQNASYDTDSGSKATVGIAIGYANCGASNIGVLNGKLSVQKTGYTTVNSIVGGYDGSKVNGDDISGVGANFGSSLDVDKLYERLCLIYANKTSGAPSPYLPATELENGKPILSALNCMPLTVANDITSAVYSGNEAKETPSNQNVGYFCGKQNKLYADETITFATNFTSSTDQSGKITYSWSDGTPKTFFKRTGDNATATSENILAMTEEEIAALPESLQAFLPDDSNSITHSAIRLQQKFESSLGNSNGNFSNHGTISYYGNTYSNVYLPNNGIWVKPKTAGKMRFLVWSGGNGSNFTLYKIKRNVQNTYDSETEFLQEYFSTATLSGTEQTTLHSYSLVLNAIYYFEYDVSDIADDEEFLLSNDRGSGAYFLYLDMGTSGSEGGDTVTDPKLENIDFIYKDSSSNVVLIGSASATKVIVTFETKQITYLYFYRPSTGKDETYTLYVKYNGTAPEAKTSSDGGCSPVSDSNLNGETFLTYPSAT